MSTIYINIAGLVYKIPSIIQCMENYRPFIISSNDDLPLASCVSFGNIDVKEKTVCHRGLAIDPDKELTIYKLRNRGYYVAVKYLGTDELFEMMATPNWDQVILSRNLETAHDSLPVIDIFMMLTFIYSSANYHTILLHASCIKYGEDALAFIGESGAGKSTHSRLWLNNMPGTILLNDDQPAVRILDNQKIKIYGTPWSGKTSCYLQNNGTLVGIARMKQAKTNELIPLHPIGLFQELLSSSSMIKEDADTFRLITGTIAKISSNIPGCILKNKPEKNAVILLYNYMFKTRKN